MPRVTLKGGDTPFLKLFQKVSPLPFFSRIFRIFHTEIVFLGWAAEKETSTSLTAEGGRASPLFSFMPNDATLTGERRRLKRESRNPGNTMVMRSMLVLLSSFYFHSTLAFVSSFPGHRGAEPRAQLVAEGLHPAISTPDTLELSTERKPLLFG